MKSSLGVDFSSFGGSLDQGTVACWRQQGIEYAIPQYSAALPQHLEALRGSGLRTEVYVYLYFPLSPWNQTPEDRVRACLNMLHGRDVKRVWLDVEETNDTPAGTVAAVQRCVKVVEDAGLAPGIYTGRWIWPRATGNSAAFAHLPLWHAEYTAPDGAGESHPEDAPDFDTFIPYGGWTRPRIWQFQNTHPLCGHSVDLNKMEEPMTNEQAKLHMFNALLHDFDVVPVSEGQGVLEGEPTPTVRVRLQPIDGQPAFAEFTIWAKTDVV